MRLDEYARIKYPPGPAGPKDDFQPGEKETNDRQLDLGGNEHILHDVRDVADLPRPSTAASSLIRALEPCAGNSDHTPQTIIFWLGDDKRVARSAVCRPDLLINRL